MYLYGALFKVIMDHKPLVAVINNPLIKTTARNERLCLHLQPYKLEVLYEPGETNQADYLSRHPIQMHSPPHRSWVDQQIKQVYMYVNAINDYQTEELAQSISNIQESTTTDMTLQAIISIILNQKC